MVLAGFLAGEGLRFFAGMEGRREGMAGLARNAAVAAVDEGEGTQRGTIVGTIGEDRGLHKEGLDFGV